MAGLTAAAYLAKSGKNIVLLEKENKLGGLVNSFTRNGVFFDGGIRSMENSGIVFPMLKQLGIEIEFLKSTVSVGLEQKVLRINDDQAIEEYESFLKEKFSDNQADIDEIISVIRKIMGYMDIMYGIDNPLFVDLKTDRKYLFKTLLPWLAKYLLTYRKVLKLNTPVDQFLDQFSDNQQLKDNIGQHFFRETPASFALSYFSLYMDYHYPVGGTEIVPLRMASFIEDQGGSMITNKQVIELDPELQYIETADGSRLNYKTLIWAADQKQLYRSIKTPKLKSHKLASRVEARLERIALLKGGDSVFTVYLTVDLPSSYFANICTGHFFYTPSKLGLSAVDSDNHEKIMTTKIDEDRDQITAIVLTYLKEFCELNTFEISIPALRDSSLSPPNKTGLIISLLFDYDLIKKIDDLRLLQEAKTFMEQKFINVLSESIFPGMAAHVSHHFSSTPLTIERFTGNTGGAITGWAFTNPEIPVVHQLSRIASAANTILPNVYQAGQWSYSPSGFPISILTGKLASDKVLKKLKH